MGAAPMSLFGLLDPRQYWPGHSQIRRVDGEDFRHVALILQVKHRRAVAGAILCLRSFDLAQFIMQSHIGCRHVAVNSGIQLRARKHDSDLRGLEAWEVRPCCDCCGIELLTTTTACAPARCSTPAAIPCGCTAARRSRGRAARAADHAGSAGGSARFTASRAGTRQRIGASARPAASALRTEIWYRISRHEDGTHHTGAFWSVKLRMSDVDTQRPIAR